MLRCPRCLKELDPAADNKFCPRCGLPNAAAAAADNRPLDVVVDDKTYRVGDLLSTGAITNVYRCLPCKSLGGRCAVMKVARDAINNSRLVAEAQSLRKLFAADPSGRFAPFLPEPVESFAMTSSTAEPSRQANILAMHRAVVSVDEFYSLEEVRGVVPAGLGTRDMAWIWRRLLTVLDFSHRVDVVHGSVFPMHVFIEPGDHKLMLIDWCSAASQMHSMHYPSIIAERYQRWTRKDGLPLPFTPASDLVVAARSMGYLLGADDGDPSSLPTDVEPAIRSHLRRCVNAPPPAGQLLAEFDKLIEALWGPRQFHSLTLPPKRGR